MGSPYVGEVRIFAGSFAPAGWHFCDGAPMPISENDVLFNLIGTTYGGDGQETFNLPNLGSRVPMHQGNGHVIGETGGTESVTLTTQQIPVHSHAPLASADPATQKQVANMVLGRAPAEAYATEVTLDTLSNQSITPVGGSQPHENMQPYIAMNYIISLFGIFPHQ
jgi:microcystin-dependent protein